MAALDIKKAFDCVNHKLLIFKLNTLFNINESATKLFDNYLTNRSQILKCNNLYSSERSVSTGVPQGSVLGPLLFLIFINDITENKNCYLFADDCLIMCSGPDPVTAAHRLEESLAHYSNWYTNNLLTINSGKTNIMTISIKRVKLSSLPVIKFNSFDIKQCEKIKYLGFFLDRYLTLKQNLSRTKQKLYPVIQDFHRNRKFITPYIASIWYTSLIRPILEYGAPSLYTARKFITSEFIKVYGKAINFFVSFGSVCCIQYQNGNCIAFTVLHH